MNIVYLLYWLQIAGRGVKGVSATLSQAEKDGDLVRDSSQEASFDSSDSDGSNCCSK